MTTTLADQERTARQFAGLCAELRVEPDRNGEAWIPCPICGREKKHFSFSERGFKCFGCDFRGRSLRALAEKLALEPSERPARVRQEAPRPRQWQSRPDYYLERYCEALDRLERWQAYKPLSLDTIARFRLGVGVLPASRCKHRRLIVPVFSGGKVVAFHGRAFRPEDQDTKWLCAGGSDKRVLFVAGVLRPGCTVVIVENYVDAILAWQVEPAGCYIPLGGLSWQPEWTQQIAQVRPRGTLIWLDNDGVGCPNEETYRLWRAEWLEKARARGADMARVRPPEPRGPQIANDLLGAGVRTSVYRWPNGTPMRADIGSELMK